MTKGAATEQSTLCDDLSAAYGLSSHATIVKAPNTEVECFTDYEPLKLSTFRVFFLSRGTIVGNSILFTEQLLITLVFISCALPVYYFFKTDMPEDQISLRRFLSQQENKMRAFAKIMTGLAAFLLSFYTATTVGRWWTMRTSGVGAIKASTVDLHMLLHQCVTKEEQVLSAVQRYGRASLVLIFMWRRKEMSQLTDMMTKHGLLTDQECAQLLRSQHCLHETIWAWQVSIVTKLHMQGKIKSDRLFGLLLEKCTQGRAAAQCIHTHLAVKVPMMYVHLLGMLVKMHNLILAIIMGLLFGAALRSGYFILCVQLFARTLILPFLFNAILLINCDLSDPFNGGDADFPGEVYQATLGKDCVGISDMANNLPEWLESKSLA